MNLRFDSIEDYEPKWIGRRPGKLRGKRVFDREAAQYAVLLARRVLIADPNHNPHLADALLAATRFIDDSRPARPDGKEGTP